MTDAPEKSPDTAPASPGCVLCVLWSQTPCSRANACDIADAHECLVLGFVAGRHRFGPDENGHECSPDLHIGSCALCETHERRVREFKEAVDVGQVRVAARLESDPS